jgi:hypothetical protein
VSAEQVNDDHISKDILVKQMIPRGETSLEPFAMQDKQIAALSFSRKIASEKAEPGIIQNASAKIADAVSS